MAEKMRIGELLLLQERIDPWILSRTLKEQASTRQRLVSLLINRALLDFDQGAMALSEQLGYPAAMERHLERRDPAAVELIPPELGGRWVVLPLGRARTGELLVVARDPTPILAAALEHAAKTPVILAVTPGIQIERLVRATYGIAGPPEEPLPEAPPSLADIGDIRLDGPDPDTPAPLRRARTVSGMFKSTPELPPSRGVRQIGPLDAALEEIDKALTRSAVERLVMAYAATRWQTSVLVRIANNMIFGVRAHGPEAEGLQELSIPLKAPSIVQRAYETRHVTTERPSGRAQERLTELLGFPDILAAAPVLAANEVEGALVVGDPIGGDLRDTLADLDRLVDALGGAYARFGREGR